MICRIDRSVMLESRFTDLPTEILYLCFGFLKGSELVSTLVPASKFLKELVFDCNKDRILWKELCENSKYVTTG